MGIFRWQCSHGFTSKQHHSLMHLKPKYNNIKQEVLHNPYFALSNDQWNQTLRKSIIFEQSFVSKRIKTSYDGKYDDKISQQIIIWKKGEIIDMSEIVILKLYTDFNKLQAQLKKCFRFETMSNVFKMKGNIDSNIDANEQNNIFLLEMRLRTFYWWRIKLLTVLNKFAQELDANKSLYHGVNSKMIINKKGIQPFHGPLSASSSYYVARSFGTAKGMVLEILSQFPRLNLCKAFDVSLISEFPEEKEWIISFAYLRIINVFTRPLNIHWNSINDVNNNDINYRIPLSSKTRSIFFAVHLFRQQIFSMAVHLEYWLTAFLYLHCNYNELCHNMDNDYIKKTKFVETLMHVKKYKYNAKNDDLNRYNRILNILRSEFDHMRKYPNQKQVVRIDTISENLKPYFMDYIGLDIYNNPRYVISFEKIVKIFENVQEIRFVNEYLFGDEILNRLVQYLFKNPATKVKTIKFLYYDYDENNSADIFYDPEQLDKISLDRLKKMQWNITGQTCGKTVYEIKIFCNATKKKKINGKKHKKRKTEMNGYQKALSEIKISYLLTNIISKGIREKISDDNMHSYMIKASSLHKYNTFTGKNGVQFKIFNFAFHDSTTGHILYFVAKRYTERRFKWKIVDRIFNADDIKNQFGISKDELPTCWKSRPCFAMQLHRKYRIINLIKNQIYIQKLIRNIAWHKTDTIPIYNKRANRGRITYSLDKRDFIHKLSTFMRNDSNTNLIPILIRNKYDSEHHIEFIQIIKITMRKEECDIAADIGLSYEYESQNNIKVRGIYLDKHFILSQHQLISDCDECKCLDGFKCTIDHLTIGNPDKFKNNMQRYKNECEKLKTQNTIMKKKLTLKSSKLTMKNNINVHSIAANNNNNYESKSELLFLQESSKLQQNINNFYFQQTLNPLPMPIIPHPIHQLPITTQPILPIINTKTPKQLMMSTTDPTIYIENSFENK